MLPYSADCYDEASAQCSKGTRETPRFPEPTRSGGTHGGNGLPSQAKCTIGQFAIAFVRTTEIDPFSRSGLRGGNGFSCPIPSLADQTGIGLLLREFCSVFSPCCNLSPTSTVRTTWRSGLGCGSEP